MRLNIWAYDIASKQTTQLTKFTDFDITYMSAGKQDLVFEVGGVLNLMNLNTQQYKPVNTIRNEDIPEYIRLFRRQFNPDKHHSNGDKDCVKWIESLF